MIFSLADLRRAARLRRPPDFFELRLDALVRHLNEIEATKLSAPAHPHGARSARRRHERFGGSRPARSAFAVPAPRARVDIELRSAPALRSILDLARDQKNPAHHFVSQFSRHTTRHFRLHEKAHAAKGFGADIFKIATRTDTRAQLKRLLDFYDSARMPVAAMGLGHLGRAARREADPAGLNSQLRSSCSHRNCRPAIAF